MPDAAPHSPEVDRAEDLYRAITTPQWWIADRDQPLSSAAFSWPCFSVNIASLMTYEEAVRHLQEVLNRPEGGLVKFNCGHAKDYGFDVRKEIDPLYPENKAHANVYSDGNSSKRKTRARKLVEHCYQSGGVLLEPSF